MRRIVPAAAALILLMTGCRGIGERDNAAACSPRGTSLRVAAENLSFDKQCLAAPSGKPFAISFENRETVGHNIAILREPAATDVLVRSTIAAGPRTLILDVGPLQPGTYVFRCEVHPEMRGILVVK